MIAMAPEERARLRVQLAIVAEARRQHAVGAPDGGCGCSLCHGPGAALVDAVPQLLAEVTKLEDDAESREAADIEAGGREGFEV